KRPALVRFGSLADNRPCRAESVMSALPPKADMDRRDGECPLCAIRVGLIGCCPRDMSTSPRNESTQCAVIRRPTLESGCGVLKQKRARNRSQRQRGYDDDSAGDANGVAEESCSRRRDGGRPDRDCVEHAEKMCAPFRRGIVWHRAVDHGGDAVKHKT